MFSLSHRYSGRFPNFCWSASEGASMSFCETNGAIVESQLILMTGQKGEMPFSAVGLNSAVTK